MKKAIGYFSKLLMLLSFLGFTMPVFAQGAFIVKFCDAAQTELSTAIGCVSTNPSLFIGKLITISLGIAGGIAFLLIVMGGLQIQMSAGNPENLQAGRELVEGAIVGLLLIIFSVFILKMIGVNILSIPGFQ